MGDRVMHMAEAERRINQVKNDVDEIYGRLTVIEKVQSEHTKQLRTLNDTVAKTGSTTSTPPSPAWTRSSRRCASPS
jgi:hypothetical protein